MFKYSIERDAALRGYEIYCDNGIDLETVSIGVIKGEETRGLRQLVKFIIPDMVLRQMGKTGVLDKWVLKK